MMSIERLFIGRLMVKKCFFSRVNILTPLKLGKPRESFGRKQEGLPAFVVRLE